MVDLAHRLCGQFRDHTRAVFPSLNSSILSNPNISVDVFIDTWDEVGQSQHHMALDAHDMALEAHEPLDYRWMSMYPTLAWLRVERLPANASHFLHGLEMPTRIAKASPNHHRGTLPNLWKMQGCADAIRDWEAARGRPYEAVMKMRPDGKFWSGSELDALMRALHMTTDGVGTMRLYHSATAINPLIQVSDKYAVGTSVAMRYYLSAWHHAGPIWDGWCTNLRLEPPSNSVPVGERLMLMHMRNASFNFTVYRGIKTLRKPDL